MSKIVDILTADQVKELNDIANVLQTEADIVKKDFEENPTELSEKDVIVIHQHSTLLNDTNEKLSDIAYNITPKKK
jgi:hypothetical protein